MRERKSLCLHLRCNFIVVFARLVATKKTCLDWVCDVMVQVAARLVWRLGTILKRYFWFSFDLVHKIFQLLFSFLVTKLGLFRILAPGGIRHFFQIR